MKKSIYLALLIAAIAIFFINCKRDAPMKNQGFSRIYSGKPYIDSGRALKVQTIPGKLECEFYDTGGDSVAYHDSDKNNNGSGSLNKGEGYLNNFRISEAPDISYTKFHDSIDNSLHNLVPPEKDQLYLGWTEPGEWTRYSMDVIESGFYQIGVMYTSNRGGAIQIIIDDTDTTGLLNITSTFDAKDPLGWRQWHHWNYQDSLTTQYINAGRRIITLKIAKQGNFNFDYLLFSNK
jgi:hypothetical protein